MTQLELPLGRPAEAQDFEFLVTESNAHALHQLERWATWPVMAALLVGPRKSGRSLLARLFAAQSGGTMIDNAERVAETDLFHAWNRAQAEHRPLLMVADAAPPIWSVRLPDLRSRLAATPVLTIGAPDDRLMLALLARHFERRELFSPPKLVQWIVDRIERSHLALVRVADAIEDEAGRSGNRRLSNRGVEATLRKAGLLVERAGEIRSESL